MHIALYQVAPRRQPVDGVLYAIEVPSNSRAGMSYDVRQLADGSLDCSCPGFRYQARHDGLCAHTDVVMRMIAGVRFLAEIL